MKRGSRTLDFSYDASGTPVSIKYRSSATATPIYYYYGINSRGDVVSLYNSDGSVAAIYAYDAYGKLLSVKTPAGIDITSETAIANLNPLRYRGHVYDNETGFYYLQTRYYDPTTCRFINSDGQLNIDSFNGFNQFAYCNNNPIMGYDPAGNRYVECCPSGNCNCNCEKSTTEVFTVGTKVSAPETIYGRTSFWWFDYEYGRTDAIELPAESGTFNIYLNDKLSGGLEVSSNNVSVDYHNGIFETGAGFEISTNNTSFSVEYSRSISFTKFTFSRPIIDNGYVYENFHRVKINNHHVAITVLTFIFAPYAAPIVCGAQQCYTMIAH